MIKNMIKQQQMEAKGKKYRCEQDKKDKAKKQMHEKLAREENQRLEYENNVSKMELEEQQLIARLKNT